MNQLRLAYWLFILAGMLFLPACPSQTPRAGSASASFAYPKFWPEPELKVPADAVLLTKRPPSTSDDPEDGKDMFGDYLRTTVYVHSNQAPDAYYSEVKKVLSAKGYTQNETSPNSLQLVAADKMIMVYIGLYPGQNYKIQIEKAEKEPLPF